MFAPRKGMADGEIVALVASILGAATLEEKVAMMSGHGFLDQMRESKGRWGALPR